jgi:hypothetical protein
MVKKYDTYQINNQLVAYLVAKHPYTTWFVEVDMQWPLCEQTINLLDQAFTAKGWYRDPVEASPVDGLRTVGYGKNGTGLFGGWTQEESTLLQDEARAILDSMNIGPVGKIRYALNDLL